MSTGTTVVELEDMLRKCTVEVERERKVFVERAMGRDGA